MAKYRGNSDDWLDHEGAKNAPLRGSASSKKKPEKNDRAKPLSPEEANGIVAETFPNQCRVRLDADQTEILCSYRRATVFQQEDVRERSPVAVGDRVQVSQLNPQSGVVEGVCLRRNHLIRPAPGKEIRTNEAKNTTQRVIHVIAANIEYLMIVTSAAEPAFSSGMVDRYLVAASHAGIKPLICLNKVDLFKSAETKPTELYADLGYPVFEVSSKTNLGLDALKSAVLGKSVVFCGQSGVGKTSLLRNLLGAEIGKIGVVSQSTGKGRHTTTAAILLGGPDNSQWIDTPGVREFGLSEILPENLASHFPELKDLKCPQDGCFHEEEEGCLAHSLPRYSSYLRILNSLRSGEN